MKDLPKSLVMHTLHGLLLLEYVSLIQISWNLPFDGEKLFLEEKCKIIGGGIWENPLLCH